MVLGTFGSKIKRRRSLIAATGFTAAGAVIVAGAIIYPGVQTADVQLNDGSIWVTNQSKNMVGHLNYQSQILDGGFSSTQQGFDVLQQAGNVFMDNDSGSLLNPVDVPAMALGGDTRLGGSKQFSLGLDTTVLADKSKGEVWATPSSGAASFTEDGTKPLISDQPGVVAVAGLNDHRVYAADPGHNQLTTVKLDAMGVAAKTETAPMDGLSSAKNLQLTVVGQSAVGFDPDTGTLFLPGNKKLTLDEAKNGMVQQHSADGNFVAVETSQALVTVPLDGGTPTSMKLPKAGAAIAPIQQSGCVHGAWSGVNSYVHYCPGGGSNTDNKVVSIPKAAASSKFVLRQNRDIVVLNDITGGDVWLVNQNMVLVNNWNDLEQQIKNTKDGQKDSADPNVVQTLPDRTKPNRPPVAVADEFGVRAGQTTVLPVLYNDSDPDGDILTVSAVEGTQKIGALQTIYGGTGLQIKVPDAATGDGTFSYTVDDGRGGNATAVVALHVIPPSTNRAPVQKRETTMVVAQGKSVSQNVLSDWQDPDGDDVFLTKAVAADPAAQVKTTPDGKLTYADSGGAPGDKTVTITVSDGVNTVDKKLVVSVTASGQSPPLAVADYVKAVAGKPIVISPLNNDVDPSGGQLRLASIDRPENTKVSDISDTNTVTFTSTTAGTVYLVYQVTNGPKSSQGLIRVQVDAADAKSPPIAVKDMAMLPSGGSTLVDVLGNDTDPAGGVLVVKSVTASPDSPVSATLLDHNIVKITDTKGLTDRTTLHYTVANGSGTSTGDISLVHVPSASSLAPPVAAPDTINVRAGDVVTIPVLQNDSDPNGDALHHPVIVQAPPANDGKLWVDQDALRFIAGSTAKTVEAIYKVTNNSQQSDSAKVTINVIGPDPEHNLPPEPKGATGRVIAGQHVRIPIDLNGIDPEGDSVQLVGVDQAPTLGTAIAGSSFIDYTAAGNSAGTDAFTYRVRDRLGAEATGTVNVGIAGVDPVNHPPVGNDDLLSVRPGRRVAVDVLLNDSDPDGDTLGVDPNGFTVADTMKTPTLSKAGRVIVTAPDQTGLATVGYTIKDGAGLSAHANIRLNVTPTAPLQIPIARDDTISEQEAMGKSAVDVAVKDNDDDPDGVVDDLKLSVQDPNAHVTADGKITVTLTPVPQMIPYTETDVDGQTATAIIWAPGKGQQYPVLAITDPIKLTAGESPIVDLSKYVKVRDGHSPRITVAEKVAMIGASADGAVGNNGTSLKYASSKDFYGPGSITFEVTDGTKADDPQGLKSTLTIMTDVAPSPDTNKPPTFAGAQLDVPKGDSATLDLRPLVKDPDSGDSFTFDFAGAKPGQFDVSLKGDQLTVKAKGNLSVGTTDSVQLKVSDGHNPAVEAQVSINVVASNKPRAVANDDVVADAHAGRTESVPVLANDVNPFPDTPLKILGAVIETGDPATKVVVNGDKVDVTTPDSFSGVAVVRYTVADKTGDVDRQVEGRIRLTVKGRPNAPAAPRVLDVKDSAVNLQWASPADNGSPITSYTVKWAGGSQSCPANTCTITGLINAHSYTFTVSATNAVMESPDSPPSAPATPDRSPDAPAAPTITRGDTQLVVTWVTPVGQYSPVESYNVEISPTPAGQNGQKAVTGNTVTWTGLTNGTAYTFRVQATNKAPQPSAWSAYAPVPVSPAGKPSAPTGVKATRLDSVGSQNNVRVDWNQPNLNGGKLQHYTVTEYLNSAATTSVTSTTTTVNMSLPNAQGSYTFTVTATTEVDTSAASAASAPFRSVSKPGTVTNVSATPSNTGGSGGQLVVKFTPLSGADLHGSTEAEISYTALVNYSGASHQQAISGSGGTVTAPNGASTTVTVVARSTQYSTAGDASAPSGAVKPYGNPGTPGASASGGAQGDYSVTFNWSPPGGAVDSAQIQISIDGGGWENVAASGSRRVTGSASQQHTIDVRSLNSVGTAGPVKHAQANAGAKIPPIQTSWDLRATPTDTCLEYAKGASDHFTPGNPPSCSSQWLPPGTTVQIDCYRNTWGSNLWYHITTGGYTYRFARGKDTTLGGTPPGGMPSCPASY